MSNSSKPTPTHVVCFLVGPDDDATPIPAGAAWQEDDCFQIQLEVMPLNGLLIMQPRPAKAAFKAS